MLRSINFRPALLWFSISFTFVLALGAIGVAYSLSPVLQQKFESVHYRLLEMVPPPPHTEFVPTPLPTRSVAQSLGPTPLPSQLVGPVLDPTWQFVGPVLDHTPTAKPTQVPTQTATTQATPAPTRKPTLTPDVPVRPILTAVQLTGVTNDYQRWNNCGPTTLEMNLSFFGRNDTQAQIASVLKPDPDDNNVSPDEMAGYAQIDGLDSIYRINGTLDRIKLFLSNGLPVIVETGFDPPQAHEGWMGHYRLITGYNDKTFITQDSYDGPNVAVEFGALDDLWRDFNRTYIVLYNKGQAPLVRAIVGDDLDDSAMYTEAVAQARHELASNPNDAFAEFNLGSSLVGLGKYNEAAAAYDTARVLGLPWRMLWYQFGPYEAYLQVGRYYELIALADATLKPASDLEESHYYKGLALEKLGQAAEARVEFSLALQYNKNYTQAQLELALLTKQ
jgi:uncharacterized protein YvpB